MGYRPAICGLGYNNNFFGEGAGYNNSGFNNNFLGYNAGMELTPDHWK